MEGDRRRHARTGSGISALLEVQGARWAGLRVLDLSAGGALLELAPGAQLPLLGERVQVQLARGGQSIGCGARVVRLRWSGRERGRPVAPAVALVFDDGGADAARRLSMLMAG